MFHAYSKYLLTNSTLLLLPSFWGGSMLSGRTTVFSLFQFNYRVTLECNNSKRYSARLSKPNIVEHV